MKIALRQAKSTRCASVTKSFSVLALAVAGVFCGSAALAAPILGSDLASFAVLGASGVTNVPTSTIGGNLGSAPNGSVGGGYIFTAGSLQQNTLLAQNAQVQLDAAILAVNAHVATLGNTIAAGALNLENFQTAHGGVISPGTYSVASATSNFDSTIILDGGNSNVAQWYLQFTGTLITGTTSKVLVQNVGDGSGVGIYWTVASAATLNGPIFAGNVLAHDLISSDGDLTINCGRLLSAETKVTLIHDKVSIVGCGNTSGGYDQHADIGSGGTGGSNGQIVNGVPEPGTLALLGLGLAAIGFARRRHS